MLKKRCNRIRGRIKVKNFEWCKYTYMHRKAFAYCVEKFVHEPELKLEMQKRAKVHDMDKMVMYLFLEQSEAQKIHTDTQPHHLENKLERTYEDLVEAVIDYECAPYTKSDKPLNAYDFVRLLVDWNALDEKTGKELISIMEQLCIARSGTVEEDREGLEYINSISDVTEEMILEEILEYVNGLSQEKFNTILAASGRLQNPW